MKGQTHGGKGSTQRKTDSKKFGSNWDSIYKTPKKKKTKKKQLDFYFIICYNMQSNYFNNCPYGETVNER